MKTLVIGAAGFVGEYLLRELSKRDEELYATKLPAEKADFPGVIFKDLDITDNEAVVSLLTEIRPDRIYHLAALSSAKASWKLPQLTMNINIIGTLNIMEAMREHSPESRLLLIGSGEEYGLVNPEEVPIKETVQVRPQNPYAVSKLAQNLLGGLYQKAYGLDIRSVRAFNHIGPHQLPVFAAADFCRQVAEIERGVKAPVLRVGNLSAKRDFTDVRDVVRAYVSVMEKGVPGKTYNVGGGTVCTIDELLKKILSLSSADISVEVDPDKLRPVDAPEISADISELTKDTGFTPSISLEQTLREMLDDARKN